MHLFGLDRCALVGMVHLLPLPGSPRWAGSMTAVLDRARRDAEALVEGGADAILVENMHDVPYLRGSVPPETVAAVTLGTAAVREFALPVGLQILAAANREALGVAAATGACFVRAEGFAYAHVADEGWIDACAADLLRARAALGVDVAVWADVRKKHAAHAVTGDLSLVDIARGTAFNGADVLVVTGASTGDPTSPADLDDALAAGLPVAVGSGVTDRDAQGLARRAQALIVGSWLKHEGDWRNPVDVTRVRRLAQTIADAARR